MTIEFIFTYWIFSTMFCSTWMIDKNEKSKLMRIVNVLAVLLFGMFTFPAILGEVLYNINQRYKEEEK